MLKKVEMMKCPFFCSTAAEKELTKVAHSPEGSSEILVLSDVCCTTGALTAAGIRPSNKRPSKPLLAISASTRSSTGCLISARDAMSMLPTPVYLPSDSSISLFLIKHAWNWADARRPRLHMHWMQACLGSNRLTAYCHALHGRTAVLAI